MKIWVIGFLALGLVFAIHAGAGTIGFIEDFSLAQDRAKALELLIPGTEDYYFYNCLQAQHSGDAEKVRELLGKWIRQYGNTERVHEIQNREALLEYEKNPGASLAHIQETLHLQFNHQREQDAEKSGLPSRFDPAAISTARFMAEASSRYQNLDGITDAGLDILDYAQLDPNRRRDLLRRLQRPDIPGLAGLVVEDLRYKHSGGFGSHPIHSGLLKSQMDECIRLMPELLRNSAFVSAYLARLAPDDDKNAENDPAVKKAWLERMWAFAETLDPVHNSLKAHILYHLLDFRRTQGNYDSGLFMTYIRLPRNVSYIAPEYIRKKEFRDVQAGLDSDFSDATRMPPVHDDTELVRDYLFRFFVDARDYSAYSAYVREEWLKPLFAETKILNGIGDMEQWYAMMDPNLYQKLKERVDIRFAPENPAVFGVGDPVRLDLEIKNVKNLIVKIFEINAFNYYRSEGQEIDTAINLDGLAATWEKTFVYEEPPLRRVRRNFEFPEISAPGVYVAEFIGSGKSSRALIRKGKLQFTETVTSAGHAFTVFDETRKKCTDAAIWLSGHEYRADADGSVLIPFTTEPGEQKIILTGAGRCSSGIFTHMPESYRLSAGFHTDAESLTRGRKAVLLVRPVLTLNSVPVSLSLLEDPVLEISSADLDGIVTSRTVPGFQVFEDKESVFEFQVPENLRQMAFTLKARVKMLTREKKEDVSDQKGFEVNAIDTTEAVHDIFLGHADGIYILDVLGRNGEPKPDVPVHLVFRHRYFTSPMEMDLKTGADGRIRLSALDGIESLGAGIPGGIFRQWQPEKDRYQYPYSVHVRTGDGFRFPYTGKTDGDARLHYTLLERRGPAYFADRTDAVSFRDGFLEIMGLEPGDYGLFLKDSGWQTAILVTDGTEQGDFLVSDARILERSEPNPLQMVNVMADKDKVTVQLVNTSEFTRLHVIATRFLPPFDLFGNLAGPPLPGLRYGTIQPALSRYIAMRDIGDEYRYVLERKYAEKFPGNLLDRPELLLNPWSVRKTETAQDSAKGGEAPASMMDELSKWAVLSESRSAGGDGNTGGSGFDFLENAPVVLANLKPDKDGQIMIDRKDFGDRVQIHLLAVDPDHTVYREISLADKPLEKRDLRMVRRLDPEKHFTEQKKISVIRAGETFRIEDMNGAAFEIYDSLDKAYQLLMTLNPDADLKEFGFILKWPGMNDAEKQEKYSKYACHELNFFLFHKDVKFFDRVIRPYLKNKKDKTFMDQWFLGDDLSAFRKEWAFAQLNIVEKILLLGRGDGAGPYVKNLCDLIPPDPENRNRLFDMALKGRSLEESAHYGYTDSAPPVMAMNEEKSLAYFADSDKDVMVGSAKPEMEMANAPAPQAAAMKEKMVRSAMPGKMDRRRKDAGKREEVRRFYQKLDKTEEWAENNYYHRLITDQNAELIQADSFWNDYAASDPKQPFLSTEFVFATRNFAEMMLALSVLNLPFEAGKHETAAAEGAFSLKAASLLVVFHREVQPAQPASEKISVMAGQNFFRLDDRYQYKDNEQSDKFVEGEFLYRTTYGCQAVVSNPSASPRKIQVLLQIPGGAVPVRNGFYSKSIPVHLNPYQTWAFEYFFYFPEPGNYKIYPVQAARNEAFVASAPGTSFNVVREFSVVDTTSWAYVSQNGNDEQVLDYIRTNNPNRLELEKIAFRMRDRKFFDTAIALLRDMHVFNPTLWSYGISHNVPDVIAEFLKQSSYSDNCGMYIVSPLLTLDPVARRIYEHLEYKPLINARAHRLGNDRKILNDRFYEQYERFLKKLAYQPALSQDDLMAVTGYLLLQDRVSEAMAFFKKVDPAKLATRIQYDYFQVYMDFYTADMERARRTALRYSDYPVARWQKLFRNALVQMDELAGKSPEITDAESRDQAHEVLADTEPSLDFSVESRRVQVSYRNLKTCTVNYYPMEIELLFSRSPFVKEQTGGFAHIRPGFTAEVALPPDQTRFEFDLPEQFRNSNLMIEITAGAIRKARTCYANSLDIRMMENYGHLRVAHQETDKPLPKTYVKVYARMKGGDVQFYKDGYTDLRGKFDYVSLSTDELDRVERFAILVMNDEYGAEIREAQPPKR